MANDYIGCRIGPELRSQLEDQCNANGVTISEYVRGALIFALQGGFNPFEEGYHQARALASQMAHTMLTQAAAALPQSFEEYVAIHGPIAGPGAGGEG